MRLDPLRDWSCDFMILQWVYWFCKRFLTKIDCYVELSENKEINNYIIKFVDNQQPLYSPIYSLGPMELEILKTYIKNNLVNSFIKSSKSPAGAPIFFNNKPNRSLRLCIKY